MSKLIKEEFKIHKSTKWSTINLTAIEDPELSLKAKYVHTYLITRPPNWEIRIKDIINRSTAGRDAIYSGLKELVDKKYIHREQKRGQGGKMGVFIYKVYETPTPLPEKPDTAEPDTANPHAYYYNSSSNKQSKTVS
ncbi:unnamed protein product, partial [marine sediment metagenome]